MVRDSAMGWRGLAAIYLYAAALAFYLTAYSLGYFVRFMPYDRYALLGLGGGLAAVLAAYAASVVWGVRGSVWWGGGFFWASVAAAFLAAGSALAPSFGLWGFLLRLAAWGFYAALAGALMVFGRRQVSGLVGGGAVAVYLPSAAAGAFVAFSFAVYALNFALQGKVGGFLSFDLLRLGFTDLNFTAYMMRSVGEVYEVALIWLCVLTGFVLFAATLAAAAWLRRRDTGSRVPAAVLAAALVFLASPVPEAVAGAEPVMFLIMSGARSAVGGAQPVPSYEPMPVVGRRLNVILVLADTLRADHLPIYGYGRDTTPMLANLSDGGAVSSHFYAAVPETSHSLRAMFTGMQPCSEAPWRFTLFDVLKANGYRTAIFSSDDIHWGNYRENIFKTGVDSLFDVNFYDGAPIVIDRSDRDYMLDDKVTLDYAGRWIGGLRGSDPYFMYLMLESNHVPYNFDPNLPGVFRPYYEASEGRGALRDMFARTGDIVNRYDNSILYLDSRLGAFLSGLADGGLLNDTIIVFTSDHGEAFSEHGASGHFSSAYDEQTRVPFIIVAPGLRGPRELGLGQHADVMPTILGLLGVSNLTYLDGVDLLSGGRQAAYFCHVREGVVVGGLKYVRNPVTGAEELYNLTADPKELDNLLEKDPAAADGERRAYEGFKSGGRK
jgi:arylsulfatase A-like enzyme